MTLSRRRGPVRRVLVESLEARTLLTATLDVMVLYTPAVLAAQGSTANAQTLVANAVRDSNTVLTNSAIDAQLRLVYAGEENYTESGSLNTDLDRITKPSDGFMDNVAALRDFYGADMVALLVQDSSDNLAGLAWEMTNASSTSDAPNAYAVLLADQAGAPDYTLIHELGHNLGAGHDYASDTAGGVFSYSYGYRFTANGTTYRDVMSYDPGIIIPYFSSPTITYRGVPIGTSGADNARTLRQTAPVVAQYRSTIVGNSAPLGHLDLADPGRVSGWAIDRDTPNEPVVIRVAVDGITAGTTTAHIARYDLADSTGEVNLGFSYDLPNLGVGPHRVAAYAQDTATNTATLLGEQTVDVSNWLFNEREYLTMYPDVAAAVASGAVSSGYEHYLAYGQHEGRNPSAVFDEAWYLATYPDVAAAVGSGAVASGMAHYLQFGQAELRNPSPYFDERVYRQLYPDVAGAVASGVFSSGFEHFVLFGQAENRVPTPLFDPGYYASQVAVQGLSLANYRSGYEHFLLVGNAAEIVPLALFDTSYYLQQNPDVAVANAQHALVSPFDHFVRYGRAEQRRFSPLYSESAYLSYNPDVAAAVQAGVFDSGLTHYLLYGQAEGRRAI